MLTREWRTISLQHMKVPSPRIRRRPRKDLIGKTRVVPVEQRVKWWNIVPGDQVRVLGSESDGVREVLAIDKLTNQVYLRYGKQPDINADELRAGSSVHYSKCQLLVGQYQLPLKDGPDIPPLVDVFAKRIATSPPKWMQSRWQWTRYAAATVPSLPESILPDGRPEIPWPEEPIPPEPISRPVSGYDTAGDEVTKVTWTPPSDLVHPGREKTKEWANLYLAALANPTLKKPLKFPMELCISDELANPHSRRLKQERWQAALKAQKEDRMRIRLNTLRDRLPGTCLKDALAEADWKFKQLVLAKKKETKRQRWVQRGGDLRLKAKKRRQVRKARALVRRLNRLDIKPELNAAGPTPTVEAQL